MSEPHFPLIFIVKVDGRELTIGLYSEWLFFPSEFISIKWITFSSTIVLLISQFFKKAWKTIETNESHFMYFIDIWEKSFTILKNFKENEWWKILCFLVNLG